jgi:dCTP deaminase
MLLSDREIKKYWKEKKIVINPEPVWSEQLGPASLDIRLGESFRVFNHTEKSHIDPRDPGSFRGLTKMVRVGKDQPFVLPPGLFVLAVTLEEIALPSDIGARIEGRSSWGRLGLAVHSTAGYIDPDFQGKLTLEMSNRGMLPIFLYPGMRICQLAFELLSSPAQTPYPQKKDAKYFGDKSPQESRLYRDRAV